MQNAYVKDLIHLERAFNFVKYHLTLSLAKFQNYYSWQGQGKNAFAPKMTVMATFWGVSSWHPIRAYMKGLLP